MKRDSLRGPSEASALAARFRSGVAAAAAEKDSEAVAGGPPVPVAVISAAAAGDVLARPSPVKFTVEPQSASIKPQPERPVAVGGGGKLGLDILQEDLVEFNKDDSEVPLPSFYLLTSILAMVGEHRSKP